MQKREYKTGLELTDKEWNILEPFLPKPPRSPKGGQIPASNRACIEGILWLLRSGARYKDVPIWFPSGSTLWFRLKFWYEQGALLKIWQALLGMLDAKSRLHWEECFADGTFSSAKKGDSPLERRKKERVRKSWSSPKLGVFHWVSCCLRRLPTKWLWSKKRSKQFAFRKWVVVDQELTLIDWFTTRRQTVIPCDCGWKHAAGGN